MIAFLLLQAAALAGAPGDMPALRIEGDYLLLRHLVAAAAIPAGIDGNVRLLRVPEGKTGIVLTPDEQRQLLHRRLPTLRLRPKAQTALRITFDRRADLARQPACFALNQPIAADEWIAAGHVDRVPCDAGRTRAPVLYDASARAPRAAAALAAGTYLGRVALPAKLPQQRGEEMTLRTRVGPVTIDRSAVLMQPGRAGHRAFVRLSDGAIVAATLADERGE